MELLRKIQRGLKKPPRVILERVYYELKAEAGRFWEPLQWKLLSKERFLKTLGGLTLSALWEQLGKRPYPFFKTIISPDTYEKLTGDRAQRILDLAQKALDNKINLLGTGEIFLGDTIDWHKDYKTDIRWDPAYFRSIEYANLDRPSDVKIPWEISRLQWAYPLGQAYLLTEDEIYAEKARDLLWSWIQENPFASSVNWTCTMEVGLRIITWTWFFHVFHKTKAWQNPHFQIDFLRTLYLHGDFTSRHLEKSDVNGNHYIADAAGLVFAGLFFGETPKAKGWVTLGWNILESEMPLQIFPDGVDYEASIPYHRLVAEIFLTPALYRMTYNLPISETYQTRLKAMGHFTATYMRDDGTSPLMGDNDDARVFAFGEQPLLDHRYLLNLMGLTLQDQDLLNQASGPVTETFWYFGPQAMEKIPASPVTIPSQSFPEGGFYIMRSPGNHVTIDCGPLGLAGRGGHGHNDILSFEAMLGGELLITDCGSYLYTANPQERNHFRATASHNTPQVDGIEINRFIRPDYLWNLHCDAHPEVKRWESTPQKDIFEGAHSGYRKLEHPVTPFRTITLEHATTTLTIEDRFEGRGIHTLDIPLHFAPSVVIEEKTATSFLVKKGSKTFLLSWESQAPWAVSILPARVSASYGTYEDSHKILWHYKGDLSVCLLVRVEESSH